MIERAIHRPARAPVKRTLLRERAGLARQYLAGHRRRRARQLELAGTGVRWFATALVLGLGIVLSGQAAAAVLGAANSIGATIDAFFPAPVIDRGPQASQDPIAPNAAPVLDPIDKVTNKDRLVVSGRLASYTLGGSVAAKVEIALNGSLAASPAVDADGKFSATLALGTGTNTIVVTMIRGSERVSALPRTIVLDTTPPPLTLTAPLEGATVDGQLFKVTGKTEVGATVTVNGHATSVTSDGTFSDNLTAGAGPFTIDVVARDEAGNETKKTVRVTVQSKAGETGTAVVSVALSNSTAKIGSLVTADVYATQLGYPLANAQIVVNVGTNQVANGYTDMTGRYRVLFAVQPPEGVVQVVAVVNGTSSGSAPLTVTK